MTYIGHEDQAGVLSNYESCKIDRSMFRSHNIMSHNATSHNAMSHNVLSHNVMFHIVMSHKENSHNVLSHKVMSHNVMFQDQGGAPHQGDGVHHVQVGLELLLQQDQQGRGEGRG